MPVDETLQRDISRTARYILEEDLGDGDLTAALIPADEQMAATIITRDAMTLAGRPWVDEIYRQLDPSIALEWSIDDGESAQPGSLLCRLQGPARSILSGERGALNLLQTLSATATVTTRYVDAVAGTRCQILDTRKTLPGLRLAQKYAVRCGGGSNHRIGLFDALLIKENHIAATGGIVPALQQARSLHPDKPVEIEVESLAELREALAERPNRVLLDNFTNAELVDAVRINQEIGEPPAQLEASGNLTLQTLREVAETGVDFISVGALTKNVIAIDLSMRHATG